MFSPFMHDAGEERTTQRGKVTDMPWGMRPDYQPGRVFILADLYCPAVVPNRPATWKTPLFLQ